MKAVITNDVEDAGIEEVPKPSPDVGEVVVDVSRVQLSLTECNLYKGVASSYHETFQRRIQDGGAQAFGHEFCGVISEVGDDIDKFVEGDRVYSPGKIACQGCIYCNRGYPQYCENMQILGRHRPGALAEFVSVPEAPLCQLPEEVSDAEGAALQPVASSLLSVYDAEVGTGDVVAVLGTGVMGFSCAQFALHHGAKTVLGIDIDSRKLNIVENNGITVVNPKRDGVIDRILDITDGIGADYVFEAVGGEQTTMTQGSDPLAQAYKMVRRGGTIVQIGHIVNEISLDPRELRKKAVDWVQPLSNVVAPTPNATTGELAAEMIASDRVSIDEYITHELEGLESFEQAIEITLNKEEYNALNPAQLILS